MDVIRWLREHQFCLFVVWEEWKRGEVSGISRGECGNFWLCHWRTVFWFEWFHYWCTKSVRYFQFYVLFEYEYFLLNHTVLIMFRWWPSWIILCKNTWITCNSQVLGGFAGPDPENYERQAGDLRKGKSSVGSAYNLEKGWPVAGNFDLVEVEVYCNLNVGKRLQYESRGGFGSLFGFWLVLDSCWVMQLLDTPRVVIVVIF